MAVAMMKRKKVRVMGGNSGRAILLATKEPPQNIVVNTIMRTVFTSSLVVSVMPLMMGFGKLNNLVRGDGLVPVKSS